MRDHVGQQGTMALPVPDPDQPGNEGQLHEHRVGCVQQAEDQRCTEQPPGGGAEHALESFGDDHADQKLLDRGPGGVMQDSRWLWQLPGQFAVGHVEDDAKGQGKRAEGHPPAPLERSRRGLCRRATEQQAQGKQQGDRTGGQVQWIDVVADEAADDQAQRHGRDTDQFEQCTQAIVEWRAQPEHEQQHGIDAE